jgi:hypothetical protein
MVIGLVLSSPEDAPAFVADIYLVPEDGRLLICSDETDDVELRVQRDGRLVLSYPKSAQIDNGDTVEVVLANLSEGEVRWQQ